MKAGFDRPANRKAGGCIQLCHWPKFTSCTWSRTSIHCVWDRKKCEWQHQQMEVPDFCSFSVNSELFYHLNIATVPKHNGTEGAIGWKFLLLNFPSLFLLKSDCTFSVSTDKSGSISTAYLWSQEGIRLMLVLWCCITCCMATCWDKMEEQISESWITDLGHGLWISYLQGRSISLTTVIKI